MNKLLLIFLFLLTSQNLIAQSAFYSNDLSEKDIWNLIEKKREWEKETKRLQLKLDQAAMLNEKADRTATENSQLKSINQGLYKEKGRLNTLLYFTQIQLEDTKEQINALKREKSDLQDRINLLKDKERYYLRSLKAQFKLIQKLDARLNDLEAEIDQQNYIIFNQKLELKRTILNLSKIGSDLLFIQTLRVYFQNE